MIKCEKCGIKLVEPHIKYDEELFFECPRCGHIQKLKKGEKNEI